MAGKFRDSYVEKFTIPATAVAFSRVCGFEPDRIEVQNYTSLSKLQHYKGMPAASAIVITAGSGIITKVTSDGITVGTVTDSVTGKTGKGFTIGLNTTVNIAAEILHIVAE